MKRKDAAKARDIRAAAVETVQELGIAGLSMEAVARRAGVATGTLYVYHASKEALLDAVYLAIKPADFLTRSLVLAQHEAYAPLMAKALAAFTNPAFFGD